MKRRILFIIKHICKAIIYFILLSILGINYAIVIGIEPFLQYIYGTIAVICLGAFGVSYWARYKKIAYIVFSLTLVGFILMSKYVPEIKEQLDIDVCLDRGMVYDPTQKICRQDCIKWDRVLGCIKETTPNRTEN